MKLRHITLEPINSRSVILKERSFSLVNAKRVQFIGLYGVSSPYFFSGSRIRHLEITHCNFTSLRILYFQSRAGHVDLLATALTTLVVRDTRVEFIEVGVFDNLRALRWFDLRRNRLHSLRASIFGALAELTHLDVSSQGMNIELFVDDEGGFDNNTRLVELRLNELSYDPYSDHFRNLDGLLVLEMRDGSLVGKRSPNPRLFDSLRSLTRLDISWNDLVLTDGRMFANLTSLRDLDLSGSTIVDRHKATLEAVVAAGLVNLTLTGSKVRCDCALGWIEKYPNVFFGHFKYDFQRRKIDQMSCMLVNNDYIPMKCAVEQISVKCNDFNTSIIDTCVSQTTIYG